MKYLAIETSTTRASVALCIDGHIEQYEQNNLREHAEHLLPMVDTLLSHAGIAIQNLDGIVYGKGPGSFTGLRIACSIVKGLAYPHDLPVYPISSLASIAEQVLSKECPLVLAIMDARMHEVYWGFYTQAHPFSTVESVGLPERIMPGEKGRFVLAGVGFEDYVARLPQETQQQMIATQIASPDASSMIRIALRGGCQPVSAQEAIPTYIRDNVVKKT